MSTLSIDTNLLLYCYSEASPQHASARQFIESVSQREDVAISEFVLTEFYLLLRNPAVLTQPLTAPEAVAVIQSYRQHPRWKILGRVKVKVAMLHLWFIDSDGVNSTAIRKDSALFSEAARHAEI